jgi:hypothetical protein
MKVLDPLLEPETVAVIGASRNPLKVGGSVMANLRAGGFGGRIVPVNSRAESVQGFSAVKSVLDIEGSVDLAVVAIPADGVLPRLSSRPGSGKRAARERDERRSCGSGCGSSPCASSARTVWAGSGPRAG